MDDETYYTIQVKGTAYQFKPIPDDGLAMVLTVANMGVSQSKSLKALNKVLGDSAGPEQWDQFAERLIAGEILPEDLMNIFREINKRQNQEPAPKAKTAARKRAARAQ